jgi:hypothetical protein
VQQPYASRAPYITSKRQQSGFLPLNTCKDAKQAVPFFFFNGMYDDMKQRSKLLDVLQCTPKALLRLHSRQLAVAAEQALAQIFKARPGWKVLRCSFQVASSLVYLHGT